MSANPTRALSGTRAGFRAGSTRTCTYRGRVCRVVVSEADQGGIYHALAYGADGLVEEGLAFSERTACWWAFRHMDRAMDTLDGAIARGAAADAAFAELAKE